MIAYFGSFSALVLTRWGLAGSPAGRRQAYWALLAALFAVTAFRWDVGCDWFGYWNQFRIAARETFDLASRPRELGWWSMVSAVERTGLAYPWINVPAAGVFYAGAHAMARRQPDPLGFLIALIPLLIVGIAMSGVRQGMAAGFLMLAFVAFTDRRPVVFALWVAVGSLFHVSVLVFVLLAPLAGRRLTPARAALAVLLAVPGVAAMANSDTAELVTRRYIEAETEAFGAIFRLGFLAASGAMYLLFMRRAWRRAHPGDHVLATLGALGMCACLLLLPVSSVIADRLGYYLIPVQAMIVARIPYLPLGRTRAVLTALAWLGLIGLFGVWTAASSHFRLCYVPYQTWIAGWPDPMAIWLVR